jgi:hypothetical protein
MKDLLRDFLEKNFRLIIEALDEKSPLPEFKIYNLTFKIQD